MNKIRCQIRCHTARRAHINAGLAVGHPKYPRECTLPSYRFHHVAARSCTQAKPELAAAALPHLRRFVKPSLGGKAFKSEPPVVFFPLDPKKRHLHWATWSVFGSSEDLWWPFRRSEKAPPRITKPAELRLCRFSCPSRAGIVFDAGNRRQGGIPCLRMYTYGFDSEYARSSRHCVALDSL
jgi:hypothetical protein